MFMKILEGLALALEEKNIPYMVIGGQAVLFYGEPRLTKDIDITVGLKTDDTEKIMAIADDLRFTVLAESPKAFTKKTMVLPCLDHDSGIRIDIIFSFSEYEKQALKRVKTQQIGEASVNFISVEDLIIHKIIAGRHRDIEDIQNVLEKNQDIDKEYILEWLKKFDRSFSSSYKKTFVELLKADQL